VNQPARCTDEVCITCSDSAIPVRILALLPGDMAEAETAAGVQEISIALVDAGPGDVVLVHASEAIAVQERT
jgi:hydrogenase maturation factor